MAATLNSAPEATTTIARYPMLPALKAAVGCFQDDPAWFPKRPPLAVLTEANVDG